MEQAVREKLQELFFEGVVDASEAAAKNTTDLGGVAKQARDRRMNVTVDEDVNFKQENGYYNVLVTAFEADLTYVDKLIDSPHNDVAYDSNN